MTTQSEILQSVIHFSTGCEDMVLSLQESGIYVYCFDAVNAMREFYSITILWCPDQAAME